MPAADDRPPLPGQRHGVIPSGGVLQLIARHADEAQQIVSEALLPHRLHVRARANLTMELSATRVGAIAAGRVAYGQPARVWIDHTPHYIANLTLRGQAVSRSGTGSPVLTRAEEGVVFAADQPVVIHGSADCQQLSIVAPKPRVEHELERLLGRSLTRPLQFEAALSPDALRLAMPAFQLLLDEMRAPTGLVPRATIARHLEGLIIDAMLLAQPHNYTSSLTRESAAGNTPAIARAAELMRERPDEPWSVSALAREVHLSVRALQYGFRRDYDTTPMAYLKSLRLSRARAALRRASPGATTVRDVALACGFMHMSRFAAAYRAEYGETPSTTLARGRHGG